MGTFSGLPRVSSGEGGTMPRMTRLALHWSRLASCDAVMAPSWPEMASSVARLAAHGGGMAPLPRRRVPIRESRVPNEGGPVTSEETSLQRAPLSPLVSGNESSEVSDRLRGIRFTLEG